MDFCLFKHAVSAQFKTMRDAQLFCTAVDKDELWNTYLSSFPAGTNQVFRERTEHDCSCCRQFIRTVGNVVSIEDGKLVSIWDGKIGDPAYQAVADAMSALVKSKPIEDEFLHYEESVGTDKNFEDVVGQVRTWEHFHLRLPAGRVMKKDLIASKLAEIRSSRDVFERALKELTLDAVYTVLDLIEQGSIYRGQEHQFAVKAFRKAKEVFEKLPASERGPFVWLAVKANPGSVTGIRNTSIGNLLIDLSAGMEMENAVRKFEAMVAPENYKRPTALVTKGMIEKAKATIQELGLTSALERRYARQSDITVNNIIFADRATRKVLEGDVFDTIPVKTSTRKMDRVEEIHIDRFISDVVPNISSMEVMFENRHANNLVSLIAPVDPAANPLFKWDNGFSWSYNGDVADSMRQKVQERGGRVDGVLRFTHMWNHLGRNASLMDLHVFMPGSSEHTDGSHDRYPAGRRVGWNHRKDFLSGGIQDVDYVDAAPPNYVPVENITFPLLAKLPEGVYTFKIHNWSRRPPTDSGFSAEIEFDGNVYEFEHAAPLKQKEWVTIAKIELKKGQFNILEMMPSTQSTKTMWGLQTQVLHKVNLMMLSPNYWDDRGVGNKHFFFMLDGAKNEGQARGFYNEFLRDELSKHRKVIEIVGSKMTTDAADHQLSGLGFSSTQRAEVLAKVSGNFTRTIKIVF
ncbi:hypothetical protein [Bradyrhizobium sp. SZCCHNS3053]|uniref:hypothetical protein n=1 Tax=Bradyrhizobium sp. SZCCHNS3053 TaxID=3057322 RepID=UPI002915F893|nr:hypothetical protein [Bradyrhizobium sp. SZCCHNS3053]